MDGGFIYKTLDGTQHIHRMWTLAHSFTLRLLTTLLGADVDEHGCIPSAGFWWNGTACVRPWLIPHL